jgi:hypothetical protein
MAKNTISGYGVAELTKVASRKTGEIEAQAILAEDISTLENGMVVYVDAKNNEIVLNADDADAAVDAPYLHFSNPRRYEELQSGMKNFIYERSEDYLPRLYKLTAGDIFVTNVVDTANVLTATGKASVVDGVLTLSQSGLTGDFYIKPTTMPDGSKGFEVRFLG